jgi:hypothetical protein
VTACGNGFRALIPDAKNGSTLLEYQGEGCFQTVERSEKVKPSALICSCFAESCYFNNHNVLPIIRKVFHDKRAIIDAASGGSC